MSEMEAVRALGEALVLTTLIMLAGLPLVLVLFDVVISWHWRRANWKAERELAKSVTRAKLRVLDGGKDDEVTR